jgi:hypothetical protein
MGSIRDRVAASEDIQKQVVKPWGVDIEVRTMTGAQMESLDKDSANFRSEIIIASCFDPETGEKAFRVEDIDMLNGKSALETGKLLKTIFRLNGMTADSRAELKKDSSPEEGDTSAS